MSKFKVGDTLKILAEQKGNRFYSQGDVCTIVEVGGTDYLADFRGHGNRTVIGDGRWFVVESDFEADAYYDDSGYKYEVTDEVVHVTPPPAPKLVEAFRQEAKRYNEGKPPLSYLLLWPKAIEALANVCRKGEEKYEKFNYKKGAPVSQYMDSGLRHQKAFVNGEDLDPEDNCYHLAKDIWNKMQALEVMLTPEMKERFDDRYKP